MIVNKQNIPLIEPYLGKKSRLYVSECFDSKWISSRGHFIHDFEVSFAQFVGAKYGVALSNGTVALHLALVCLNIGPGDEVIVPDLTFAATINAVLHANATPVIVDVEMGTWNISPQKIRAAITKKTKAIIPVHLYGYPCNMSEIMAIAKEHNLKIIEDCAEAHGASVDGERVGSIGDIGTFSFYGNKIITTGEGGMCTTNDAELYEKLLVYRDHGMNKTNRYHHDVIGYNYRMTNPQAAMGCAQLEEIDSILEAREKIGQLYDKELKNAKGIETRKPTKNIKSVNWIYTCLSDRRDELMEKLEKNGIETRPMFHPLHQMKIYKKYGHESCDVSIDLARKGISLPTYFAIPPSFIERICQVIS